MRRRKEMVWVVVIIICTLYAACDRNNDLADRVLFCPQGADLAAYVDPMIGTQGSGNVVPGALVPHGMVRLSPDTNAGEGSIDAYEYNNDKIEGFSHTHMQGPGGSVNGYSHILFIPFTGPLKTRVEDYASSFSHDTEEASPGFYAVTLDDWGVRAELTATAHAGYHRYTFPASDQARVLIDLGHSRGDSRGGQVEIVDDRTIQGYGVYNVHPMIDLLLSTDEVVVGRSTVYFHAVFNKPFLSHGTWKKTGGIAVVRDDSTAESGPWIGAWANFTTQPGEAVEVKVGISLVGVEQARRNLEAEMLGKSFDEVHREARSAWNCYLNRIRVEGGSEADKTIFYTALYHTLFQPADYTESGGVFFSGADGQGAIFKWEGRRFYSDDWCAWDTFRTSRPLATIVEPETVNDVVASYLHLYQQGGWLPKCTWHATGYSRVMIGNHAVSIIADAFTKGFDGYDLETAWAALYKSATEDNAEEFSNGFCGYFNLGTPPDYLENGYVSHECDKTQSASMTLEYAYDDWCIAQVAKGLGKTELYETFRERAGNYLNHWNPGTGFMQGKMRDGLWVEPFVPTDTSDLNDFCEASSWIYTWFVPHDVSGLIGLLGGEAKFILKLDSFFTDGHFDSSNEPSFHTPYLYNYAGDPARTQELVRSVLRSEFSAGPSGLPGNDDAGAMSAWYVLGAMGIYPVAPGDGVYQLSSPMFERISISLDPEVYRGNIFVIEAANNSAENIYIQSATLDGQPLNRPWITHEELVRGGTLALVMGPAKSLWGTGWEE